jgi:hypothetical protein
MATLSTLKLLLQVMLQAVPPIVAEFKRRQAVGLSNDALELAVLKHKDEIRELPIQQVIKIGTKKAD